MEDSLIYLEKFTVQQNDYKSICKNIVIEHDNFKFFAIIELRDRRANTHIDEIIEGINYAFNKIFKTKSIKLENIEELFEKSIKDLNSYIFDLIELSKVPINLKGLHSVIGIILNKSIFFTQRGIVHGYFLFKGKNAEYHTIDILKQSAKEPKENTIFSDIINGLLEKDQAILICSESVGNYLTEYNIKKILTLPDITQTTINAHLKEITNNENFTGIVLKNTTINSKTSSKPILQIFPNKKTSQSSVSITHLENTRHLTQDLLSPTLFTKLKEYISKFSLLNKIKQSTAYQKSPKNLSQKFKHLIPQKESIIKFVSFIFKLFIFIFQILKQLFIKLFQSYKNRPKNKIVNQTTSQKIQQPNTLTNTKNTNQPKANFIWVIIFLIVLTISISGFFIRNNRINAQQKSQYELIISQVEENILKAESSLIHKATGRAQIHISQSRNLLSQLLQYPKLNKQETQQKYQTQISNLEDSLYQRRKIDSPEKLIDLQKELKDVEINGIEVTNENIKIYNNQNPYLAIVNIKDQQVTLIDSPDNSIQVKSITNYEKNNNLPIILTENGKLYQFNNTNNELSEINISLQNVDTIKSIKTYGSNLYTLNPNTNKIFKFTQISKNNFGKGKEWLSQTTDDITNAIDFYIDGNIYVLNKNGLMQKFINGKLSTFTLENTIQPAINESTKLVYSTKTNSFYILEPKQKRIVVFDQTGKFLYQYIINGLNNIKDIAYDDINSQLLILNEKSIYQIKE